MTFAFHHPSYYKKLKKNSGRSSIIPSKDNVSEVSRPSNYGDVKVGKVGSFNIFSPTHTQPKETNEK